jgi:hypothetical protein
VNLFTFVFATALAGVPNGTSTRTGLTEVECNWMVASAPIVLAQMARESGRPLDLLEARCEPQAGD